MNSLIIFDLQLPEKDDSLSMWAPDVHAMPASTAFAQLALMSGVIATFAGLVYLVYPQMPAVSSIVPVMFPVLLVSLSSTMTVGGIVGKDETPY